MAADSTGLCNACTLRDILHSITFALFYYISVTLNLSKLLGGISHKAGERVSTLSGFCASMNPRRKRCHMSQSFVIALDIATIS